MPKRLSTLLAITALLLLSGCGYNTLQQQDEAIKASWSEVVNQYQRRADLIPNLVNTVKGYAAQEKDVLLGVTNALDMPARQTFVVEVVGSDQLPSGIALNSVLNSASRVLGS